VSEEEKNGGKYEKPESKDMDGDDLEDISGGFQRSELNCSEGGQAGCCAQGGRAGGDCLSGFYPAANCNTGTQGSF